MANHDRPSTLRGKFSREMFFETSPDLPRIVEVDLARLVPNPDQPRKTFDETALRELAASIEKHGLIQPVTVKETAGDTFILVAGERRYRAHKLLGKTTIAAIVTQGNPDEIALIENLQREDLNPIDAAEALSTMMERYHYSQEELGRAIGKNRVTVNELLRLRRSRWNVGRPTPSANRYLSNWPASTASTNNCGFGKRSRAGG
jgi:ParB family chromosome partitioning protein